MNWAQELVKTISGLTLSPNLAYLFIAFVVVTIGFIVWAYYYAVFGKALNELSKITWFPFKSTVTYTILTVLVIIVFGALLFGYDYILDQVVNLIIQNAR